MKKTCLRLSFLFLLSVFPAVFFSFIPLQAFSATGDISGNLDGRIDFVNLTESIDETITQEKKSRDIFASELKQVKAREPSEMAALSSLKVQYSVYSNLAVTPDAEVKSLEQAFSSNLSVRSSIKSSLSDLTSKKDRVKFQMAQTEDLIRINSDQLKAITVNRKSGDDGSNGLVAKFSELLELLNEKKKIFVELSSVYDDYFKEYMTLDSQFSSLASQLGREIVQSKKKSLFQRKANPVFSKLPEDMVKDVEELLSVPGLLLSSDYWKRTVNIRERSDFSYVVIFVFIFAFFQYVLLKGRKGLLYARSTPFFMESHWGKLTLYLFRKTLFLTGNVFLLLVCDSTLLLRHKFPVIELVIQLTTAVLLCQWALVFLKLFPGTVKGFPDVLTGKIKHIVRLLFYFSLITITALWFLSSENILLVATRMVFATLFGLELFTLNRILKPCIAESSIPAKIQRVVCYLPVTGFVFLFFGLIMDLSGYAQLAMFLSISFGKTVLLFMWSSLSFFTIQEFRRSGHQSEEKPLEDSDKKAVNTNWYLSLFFLFVWVSLSIMGILYIWSGKQAAFHRVFIWYSTPVTIGSLKFSLMEITLTICMLLLTHNAVRLWRNIFQKKILKDSGIDIGVRESITTISVYLIWSTGILLAMSMLGLNMTSIAVVLGALGIGIGFGLQNIFNNFLSGIILLFERPIKVGDDVEVNGLWATVKKINVRSTVVQTYDNATLIIPNSDFISSTVTNWSFSDKRIRRNVSIRVAYGSDIDLVKETLIEAADRVGRVSRVPRPEVLFRDFGESAMLFVLRFWTRVEYFFAVESAVRFEIDRLFNEREIKIGYPQQDLHIRTVDADLVVKQHGSVKNCNEEREGECKDKK